jgi:hypothetical protein
MTTRSGLDERIRRAVSELVDATPLPPSFPRIDEHAPSARAIRPITRRRGISWALVGVVALAALFAPLPHVSLFNRLEHGGSSGPSNASHGPPISQTVPFGPAELAQFKNAELSFAYPASWRARTYTEISSFTRAEVFLSNDAMHRPCVTHGTLTTCRPVLARLGPGGVLVEWSANGYPTWSLAHAPGKRITVDGRAAKESVATARQDCPTATEREITVVISRPGSSNNYYEMTACLRGPAVAQERSDVQAMIRSTVFAPATATAAPTCTGAQIRVGTGRRIGGATMEAAVLVTLATRGPRPCAVDGRPAVSLVDAHGQELQMRLGALPQYETAATPARVVLGNGATAYFLVAKVTCSSATADVATSMRIALPGSPNADAAVVRLGGLSPALTSCRGGPSTPGNSVGVTPVEPTIETTLP